MPEITRRFEFDAGHRVLGHEGKCRFLHGHRYVAEVTVQAPALDPLGRVVDFSVLKEKVGGWINEHWDHNLLLNPEDPQAPHLGKTEERTPFLLPSGQNPTAENLAAQLHRHTSAILTPLGVYVTHIRLYETPNCWADYPEGT